MPKENTLSSVGVLLKSHKTFLNSPIQQIHNCLLQQSSLFSSNGIALVIFHSLKSGLQMTSFACYEVFSPELYPHAASLPVEPARATYYLIKSWGFFQCYWHFILLELFQNHLLQVSN